MPNNGFAPALDPTTRRAFFDLQRRIDALEALSPRGRLYVSGSGWDAPTSGTTLLVEGTSGALALVSGRNYLLLLDCTACYGDTVADIYTMSANLDGVSVWSAPVYVDVANQYVPPFQVRGTFTTTTGDHVVSCFARRDAGTGTFRFRGRLFLYDEGDA